MKCCANCIGDRWLSNEKIPELNSTFGNCTYCKSKSVQLIEPNLLSDYFEFFKYIYKEDINGKSLVELFREDWGMFLHPNMDDYKSKDLLAEIMNDGELVRKRFCSLSNSNQQNELQKWEQLRQELMSNNRYFPSVNIDLESLKNLLSYLILHESEFPLKWYRARLLPNHVKCFKKSEMGAPPKDVISHGRANPAGIPYLYLASNLETAISEVRPHTGEYVCIAEFQAYNNLKIVDLRNPRETISPFVQEDENDRISTLNNIPFLIKLGEELTRPIISELAAVEYVPSQYLCEYIKKCDYHGVIYRSSLGDGINMALFNEERVEIKRNIKKYKISSVNVTYKEL